jgi:hypothetical protein
MIATCGQHHEHSFNQSGKAIGLAPGNYGGRWELCAAQQRHVDQERDIMEHQVEVVTPGSTAPSVTPIQPTQNFGIHDWSLQPSVNVTGNVSTTATLMPVAPNRVIMLHGEQGVGKDTVADYLVDKHGFVKLAFADRLRAMVLQDNRFVAFELSEHMVDQIQKSGKTSYTEVRGLRLAEAVAKYGWDEAKRRYPEIRRAHGDVANQIVRPWFGDRYFTDVVLEALIADRSRNYVIPDLRREQEWLGVLAAMGREQTQCWWISRPDNPIAHDLGIKEFETWHPPRYYPLVNGHDLPELHEKIDIAMTGGGFASLEIVA